VPWGRFKGGKGGVLHRPLVYMRREFGGKVAVVNEADTAASELKTRARERDKEHTSGASRGIAGITDRDFVTPRAVTAMGAIPWRHSPCLLPSPSSPAASSCAAYSTEPITVTLPPLAS
jgi:hypothetical protein